MFITIVILNKAKMKETIIANVETIGIHLTVSIHIFEIFIILE